MSILRMFVLPEELADILRSFAERRNLRIAVETWSDKNKYKLYEPDQLNRDLIQNKDTFKLFLFPKEHTPPSLEYNANSPRQMGWIHVSLGRYSEDADPRVMELTTLQSEDKKDLPFRPSTWLRALVKGLFSTRLKKPVRITNIVHGGTGLHDDVGYSEAAEMLFRDGVKWKQAGVNNQEWSPAAATADDRLNGHTQGKHG